MSTRTQQQAQTDLKKYLEHDGRLLEQYGFARQYIINFHGKRKAPLLGRLAVKVLGWTGARIDLRFTQTK